jgi:predicted DNA-binding ribbon-helix-helix protein
VSLEEAFLVGLKEIAAAKEVTLAELLSIIDRGRNGENLSSSLRLYVLAYYQAQARLLSAEASETVLS